MEGWAEYKNNLINLNKLDGFRVHKVRKEELAYTDIPVSKQKPWILSAGYMHLDAFKEKDDALQAGRDIINGKHPVKQPRGR